MLGIILPVNETQNLFNIFKVQKCLFREIKENSDLRSVGYESS